jgi:hypothetical protein
MPALFVEFTLNCARMVIYGNLVFLYPVGNQVPPTLNVKYASTLDYLRYYPFGDFMNSVFTFVPFGSQLGFCNSTHFQYILKRWIASTGRDTLMCILVLETIEQAD